jgi:hypothetical protein
MPVVRHLTFGPVGIDAHGNDRRGGVVHIQVEPGVLELLSDH